MTRVQWIFRLGAISNFLVSATAIVAPVGTWDLVASVQKVLPQPWQMIPIPALQPPSLLIIWSGMAFLWGIMMWEISKDPLKHEAMIKYTYVEKLIATYAISWGAFYHHSVPMLVWLFTLYTDVLWIVPYTYAHSVVRKQMRSP